MNLLLSLNDCVSENLNFLGDVAKAWQPTDYLPDLTSPEWAENVRLFRVAAEPLSDDVLVVLVGNMITEEALPNYSVALNYLARNDTGVDDTPWAKWLRGWSAEENRHGDLLNAYLRLTGRVNMRAVEQTVHHLINNGFVTAGNVGPYGGLIYTAFQERATKICHGNVAKLAIQQGDPYLSKICQKISGDEARHEAFYTRIMGEVFKQEPENAVTAFGSMMKGMITMPGQLMNDGRTPDLFDRFSAVSQRIGSYTVDHYSEIIEHLLNEWKIAELSVSGDAAKAQDFLCGLPKRYARISVLATRALTERSPQSFSWIYERTA